VTINIISNSGTTSTETISFKIIDYPPIELVVNTDSLIPNKTLSFHIYLNGVEATEDCNVHYWQIEIYDKNDSTIYRVMHNGSHNKAYLTDTDSVLSLEKGYKIVISQTPFLWTKHNFMGFINTTEIII
jgi:uncharacterized membrane protein